MARAKLPNWPNTPPMVPLSQTLIDGGFGPLKLEAGIKGDSNDNWQRFAVQNVADLSARSVGNAEHLGTHGARRKISSYDG